MIYVQNIECGNIFHVEQADEIRKECLDLYGCDSDKCVAEHYCYYIKADDGTAGIPIIYTKPY